MSFDEDEVNRDQRPTPPGSMRSNEAQPRDKGGRFDKKHGLTAEISLPVASEPVNVTIESDHWAGEPYNSEHTSLARDYDLRPVLDTFSTEELREFVENPYDADDVYWRAASSGLVDPKTAEHGFEVRLDGIREYIREREAAGLESALSEEVVLDAPRRAAVYHRYAVEAISEMADGIFFLEKDEDGFPKLTAGAEGFVAAHEAVEKCNKSYSNILLADEEAVSPRLRDAVAGTQALMERGRDIESDEDVEPSVYAAYVRDARKQYAANVEAVVGEPPTLEEKYKNDIRNITGKNEGESE